MKIVTMYFTRWQLFRLAFNTFLAAIKGENEIRITTDVFLDETVGS